MDSTNGEEVLNKRKDVAQERIDSLEKEVRTWSPGSSVFWALWGIVQAEEQIEGLASGGGPVDFDYLVSDQCALALMQRRMHWNG
jgi:choline kinase